jgi:hypothetical protein
MRMVRGLCVVGHSNDQSDGHHLENHPPQEHHVDMHQQHSVGGDERPNHQNGDAPNHQLGHQEHHPTVVPEQHDPALAQSAKLVRGRWSNLV